MTISGNMAPGGLDGTGGGYGGGIENGGTLVVSASTISGNSTGASSGGGFGGGISNDYSLIITNSTISGNSTNPGAGTLSTGGGIINSGVLTVIFCTIADNTANLGGGVAFGYPAPTIPISFVAVDSVFDNPIGGNLSNGVGPGGSLHSLGHNLFSDNVPGFIVDPSDLINTNPLLGPLADNGGPTWTQALLPGSPAINAGIAAAGVNTDQRGLFRAQGAGPDIGAFEMQLPPVVVAVQRHGVHDQPTTFSVIFSQPMDSAAADNLADYHLVAISPDGRLKTGGDRAIRIRSVQYDAATLTVTIRPFHRLPLHRTYQLTILGTPTAGLKDTAGLFLDGAGTRQQGSNYVKVITDKLLVPPIVHKARK